MVKISMRGHRKNIEIIPNNGEPARCSVQVELDRYVSLEHRRCDIQLFAPAEFASLLEVALPINIILEQIGDEC
jgi:hypothetical protein